MLRFLCDENLDHRILRGLKLRRPDVECLIAQQTRATVVMPMTKQFYGMREFAITDPDGYLLTFAERE